MSRTKPCSSELCSFLVSSAYYPAVGSLVSIAIFILKLLVIFVILHFILKIHYITYDFEGYYFEKILFTAEMRPAQAPGGKKYSTVYKIYHIDYLTSLTFLNSCQSSLYACSYWNSKIEKFCDGNSTHELHELHPLILLITIMLL